ncbi:MAG: tetraacyldisaccharide 4'-kinase [Terriglobia bacterium]
MNVLLNFLSSIFLTGIKFRHAAYRRGWFKTRRLRRPVISIGNLSVGGTGKTPMVILLAGILVAAGRRPCILTRGYRRRRGKGPMLLDPEEQLVYDPRVIGDEPAALAKALPDVPIVVAADRFRGGTLAEQSVRPGVFVLDDGFQHLALYRDLDVVLLDVTTPSSELALLPAGRLRETFQSLERAHWVILTRTELGDASGMEARVRAANPKARIFRGSTKLAGLVDARSGQPEPPASLLGKKVAAFCGIGNSSAFFADLRSWGFNVAAERAFPDHHVYLHRDLENIFALARAARAEAVLTTEKDLMNLPPRWDAPMPLFASCICLEIENKMEFERALLAEVERAATRRAI